MLALPQIYLPRPCLFLAPYDLTPPLCNLPASFILRFPSYTPSAFSSCFMMSEGSIEAEVLTYLLLIVLFKNKSGVLALLLMCSFAAIELHWQLDCLRRDITSSLLSCRNLEGLTLCSFLSLSLLYRIQIKMLSQYKGGMTQ